MQENEISGIIIGAAIEVHKNLGPGLLESVYEHCLAHELARMGINFQRQHPLPVIYKGESLELGFRLDLWVENKVIVEIKAVDALNPIHMAQVLTYLRLTDCKLGMLLNFNVLRMLDGVQRVANRL
ncbi:MAG: GxxExxY protein [Bacteroidia bacterium]